MGPSNIDLDSVADDFAEAYQGEYATMADFAEELLDDTGALAPMPESLRPYFDYESYGRDLVLGGDYYHAGGYVFRSL